ncbi:hypothetical protein KSF81_22025 [Siccirubricoccus sp. G192]|nr:hypothetical protein [Siccirubricoccus sp. G192]
MLRRSLAPPACSRPGRRALGGCPGPDAAGCGVPAAPGAAHRALRGGRVGRCAGAHHGPGAVHALAATGGGGQPAGRRRAYRRRAGGAQPGRWAHAGARHHRHPCGERDLSLAFLQPGHRPRPRRGAGGIPQCHHHPPGTSRAQPARADRTGAAEAGELTFGSAGNGTSTHMAGELFMLVAGVRLTHVPYRGSSQALNDLVAGSIQVMFENLPTVPPLAREGRVRVLALTSAGRSESLPEAPTAAEAGLEGYVATAWFTIAAPASTPAPLLERLNADLRAALADPELRGRFAQGGATPIGGTVEEARRFFAAETAKWSHVISTAGIRVD